MSYNEHTHLWLEPLHLLYKKIRALPLLRYRSHSPLMNQNASTHFAEISSIQINTNKCLYTTLDIVDNARTWKVKSEVFTNSLSLLCLLLRAMLLGFVGHCTIV